MKYHIIFKSGANHRNDKEGEAKDVRFEGGFVVVTFENQAQVAYPAGEILTVQTDGIQPPRAGNPWNVVTGMP